jgi:3-phytase
VRFICILCLSALAACTSSRVAEGPPPPAAPKIEVWKWKAAAATQPVGEDPDDPAIWVHPDKPELSLILATNKAAAPGGSIVVFDLEGKILQTIAGVDRPNNIDVRQNVNLGGKLYDIAVATERYKNALRIFTIDAKTRRLTQVGAPKVFEGEIGEAAAPMGVALYVRASDRTVYAILGRKTGPVMNYLWQYRIEPDFTLVKIREFGRFSGEGEIEAIVADDELGFVYYADEGAGIRKYHADPTVVRADEEILLFGKTGYKGDREGLALYQTGPKTGYLISTDQIIGGSRYFLYDRNEPGDPLAVIEGGADETDGIEAVSRPLGPAFPQGILVVMNSKDRNFLYFPWKQP